MSSVIDNPSCHGTCANCQLHRLTNERNEARSVARVLWEIALTQKSAPALLDLLEHYDWLKEGE